MNSRKALASALLVIATPALGKPVLSGTPDHHQQPLARPVPALAKAVAPDAPVRHQKPLALARIVHTRAIHRRRANKTALPRLAFTVPTSSFFYSEGEVYRLSTAPERVTDLVLQPGETLVSVASGDTARWVIGDTTSGSGPEKKVHVLVKPSAPNLSTNIVITTDRRTYHIALTSTGAAGVSVASWSYPQDSLLALKRASVVAPDEAVPPAFAPDQLNFDYAISGASTAWRPLRAFDDGRQTFIEFPASLAVGQAPPLFVLGDKGEVQLVNYRVRGRFYVVDRLFSAAELRLGTKKQQVVRIARTAPLAAKAGGGE